MVLVNEWMNRWMTKYSCSLIRFISIDAVEEREVVPLDRPSLALSGAVEKKGLRANTPAVT